MEKVAIINNKEIKILDIETLEINPKDTIIVTIDPNIWSSDSIQCILNFLSEYFPTNKNLVKMKGIEIEIEKAED